jgi:hypothetical protein
VLGGGGDEPMKPGKKNCPSRIFSIATSSAFQPGLEKTAASLAGLRSLMSRSTATMVPEASTKTAVLCRYSSVSSEALWMKVPW